MRKILLLALVFVTSFTAFGQDFSNKGKDFWVGYGYHTSMLGGGGGTQDMVLYFATDQATNIVINIPANGYTQNITTAAGNNVVTSIVIPKTGIQDAKLLTGGLSNNGIHITSDKPMVAYAHIYNGNCSGATILYPTNTLGREYYSVNYKNWSNLNNANCWFYVVATDTGTTTIEITPQADQIGVVTTAASGSWVAGTTYTVNLTQGQIYNVMGILTTANNPFKGVDLTGSRVKSINNGTGCKKIGVFSGSGRISITCTAGSSSSDNYMVQAMPKNAWGKKYLTVQANGNQSNNIYRVCVSHPAAIVKINGAVTGLPLLNNFYYEIPATAQPQLIEADSAIMVAQYFTSQGSCGNGANPGDPEVIYLSAVEQNINKVIWYATPNFAITSHSLSVVVPNTGTGLSSFTLNGGAVGGWVTHPQDANYSYLRTNVGTGFNVIQSDSGFNATAYGFGGAESYGYNAGTNIKDLYQQIGVQTTYGIENTPSVCTNSPFKFKVSLPYIPDSMRWNFNGAAGMSPNNSTVYVDNTGNIAEDSFTVVNGRTIHWYSVPLTYTFSTIGTYPITITTFVPNGECGAEQDIDFDLGVSDPPIAGFSWTGGGCVADSFHFVETTPQFPKGTYKFWWNFGDPLSGPNNDTSNLRNPVHLFSAPGTYTVRYGSITTPGCLSDTISLPVVVPDIPFATISATNTTVCINSAPPPDVTFTATEGTPPFTFTYTINAGAPQTVNSIGSNYSITIQHPTNIAGQFIYDLTQVKNVGSTVCVRNITGQKDTVTILPDHAISSSAGNPNQILCVNTIIAPFSFTFSDGATGVNPPVNLPPGLTYSVTGSVVTVQGTPTLAGTYIYSFTTTGNSCLTATAGGTITVNDDHSIDPSGGTPTQSLCINTVISPISFTFSNGATGVNPPVNLPPGLTYTVTGNVVTIQGTPTLAGTYIYSFTTTGNSCLTATAGGTITVDPDHAISSSAGNPNQILCVNTVIAPFSFTFSNGATGVNPPVNLPPGLTYTVTGSIVTVQGTPTLAGTYIYSFTTTGNSCLTATAGGTITVNDDHSIAPSGGTPTQTLCINTVISPISFTFSNGATGVNPPVNLPPGLTYTVTGNVVTIQGTPTLAGTYAYSFTTTGNTCITATAGGTITVEPDHSIAFNSGTPNPTLCVNTVMPSFTLQIGGGATNIVASIGLPPGVTATVSGNIVTIAGTPTLQGTYPYIITTNGNTCVPATYTNTIIVTADATLVRTSAAGTDAQELCRNSAITAITYDFGGSATSATVSGLPAGVTWSVTGNTVTILGSPTVSSPVAFTYTVSTVGPCVMPSVTGTILVNALPVASFTPSALRCANQDITFTNTSTPNAAGTTTYDWTFNDPNASGPNPNNVTTNTASPNTSHFFLVPNPYSVTMIATNSNGCISDPIASVTVIVNDTPRAGFIVPDVCINDVATIFTDTSKIASGTINRPFNEWNYGDGPPAAPSNNSIGINGSHLYPAPNFYDVRQIVTANVTGCRDTIVQRIVINSADPVAAFTPTNSCSADSAFITNQSTVGFGSVTRIDIYWDVLGAPGVFETILNPIPNGIYKHKYPTLQTTTNYRVRIVAYSGVICFNNSAPQTLTVYATPRVQFNSIPSTCYLVAPYPLTQGSEIGGVPGIGTYSGPGIINPNGTFSPQVAGIGTHDIKYTWTASNPGACIDTLTRTITVIDTAHATFSVALPSCEQIPTSFTNLSTAPAGVNLVSTVWNFGDATGPQTFLIAAPITHLYAGPGPYTVTMHNVSDNLPLGCLSTDTSMVINIDANHGIALTSANNNQTRCVNVAIQNITYQLSNGANNIIMPPAGLPPGVTATLTGNVVTIAGAATTAVGSPFTYSITTLGNTCKDTTVSGVITVQPDHTISYKSGDTTQSVCINTPIDPIVYDLGGGANTAVASGLPAGVTGVATAGNTFTISGTPTSYVGSPFSFTILTGGNGCVQANAIGEIAVHPYPVPGFTVDKPSYCIPNAIVKFTNTSTTPDGSGMTYLWDFGDGSPQVNSFGPTHWYTSGVGPFTVRLSVTSVPIPILSNGQPGCNSFIDVPMTTIHPQPKADFVFSKPSVCIGDNVTITDATDNKDGLPSQWNWDMGDGGKRVTNPVTYTYADTISYNITFYSVNTFGCNSDTISKPFSVYPYPLVNAGPDKFVLEGGSVELEASAFARQPIYAWTPVEFLTDSKILRPRVVSPRTDMTYRLTVTGRGGCQFSNDVFVKLLKFPVIPNTFTPNGDGINDQWRIDYLNSYPDNRVQIFTRAGKLVFESKGYTTPWDGTLKGKPLPFDTYYYIIEPGNGRDPVTGYVTIIK